MRPATFRILTDSQTVADKPTQFQHIQLNPKLTQSNATTTKGTIERERQIQRGKESERAELLSYYANKLHGRENSVLCSAGIVNVFADIWMCNVFAAICTVYTLLCGTLLLFGNFD